MLDTVAVQCISILYGVSVIITIVAFVVVVGTGSHTILMIGDDGHNCKEEYVVDERRI